jgi:hypothetical protein
MHPLSFYSRVRQALPSVANLHEAVLLVRILAEEGLVVLGSPAIRTEPEGGDGASESDGAAIAPQPPRPRRRTRALTISQIVDPENAQYLYEQCARRWNNVTNDQLGESFRAARRRLLPGAAAATAASSAGASELIQQSRFGFLIAAINEMAARGSDGDGEGSEAVILSGDDRATTLTLLDTLGVHVDAPGLRVHTASSETAALEELIAERREGGSCSSSSSASGGESAAGGSELFIFSDRLRFLEEARGRLASRGPGRPPSLSPASFHLCSWGFTTASLRARALSQGFSVLSESDLARELGLTSSREVMDGISWK